MSHLNYTGCNSLIGYYNLNDLFNEDIVLRRDAADDAEVVAAVRLLLEAQDVVVFLLGARVPDQARVLRQAATTCKINVKIILFNLLIIVAIFGELSLRLSKIRTSEVPGGSPVWPRPRTPQIGVVVDGLRV